MIRKIGTVKTNANWNSRLLTYTHKGASSKSEASGAALSITRTHPKITLKSCASTTSRRTALKFRIKSVSYTPQKSVKHRLNPRFGSTNHQSTRDASRRRAARKATISTLAHIETTDKRVFASVWQSLLTA